MNDRPPSVASRHLPPQRGEESHSVPSPPPLRGRVVQRTGWGVWRSSLHLPCRTGGRILQHNTLCEELVANAIRFLEVLRLSRRGPGSDSAFDLWRIGGPLASNAFLDRRKTKQPEPAGELGVLGLVQLRKSLGRVQIIEQRGKKCIADAWARDGFCHAIPAFQDRPAFLQSLHRPIHRLPVMGSQHVEAKHLAWPILQKIADGEEIAQALGHLLALDLKEAIVHPNARQRMTMMGALALRDFVLVMGKDEVDAAAMNVEGLAEQSLAHRRAFDVPSGPAAAER